jgi:hypothetical protein
MMGMNHHVHDIMRRACRRMGIGRGVMHKKNK